MSRPVPPEHRTTSFAEWPAEDRAAWRDAVRPGSALFDAGRGAHWADATRSRYQWVYGHWLTFLRTSGALDPLAAPAARLTPQAVAPFVDSLRERGLAGTTTAKSYLEALHNAAWGMFPDRDWGWLRKRVAILARQAGPARASAARIPPIDEVYEAGLALMDRAERLPPARRLRDSVHYRDGLLVAMLAATALRRRNFAAIEIDRHLMRQDDGYRIVVPAAEVKNRQHIEGTLPASLTPRLDRYLSRHRPRLSNGAPCDCLWLNEDGSPFTPNTVTRRITVVTRGLGFAMSPHLFRNAAATTIATVRPDLAMTIGQFLGHRSPRTAERHYNRARMIDACRRHAETIEELRRGLAAVDLEQEARPCAP